MPTAEAGKTMNGWLPKLATGLAIAGIIAALTAWGQQQGMAENVEANEKAVEVALDKSYRNENTVTAVVTELRIFNHNYEQDRLENREAHRAIMQKLNEMERKP
jgi:hypothetical protein